MAAPCLLEMPLFFLAQAALSRWVSLVRGDLGFSSTWLCSAFPSHTVNLRC